eukprot:1333315-Pyramimonas_sp.AAC.1
MRCRRGWPSSAGMRTQPLPKGRVPGHGGLLLLSPRVHGAGQFEGVGSSIIDVGRATFVHHSGFCSGGMVLVAVYLRTAEGLSRANENILHKVSTMLQ